LGPRPPSGRTSRDDDQRQTADQLQILDGQQQRDRGCGNDPKRDRSAGAEQDGLAALCPGKTARHHTDDESVVA